MKVKGFGFDGYRVNWVLCLLSVPLMVCPLVGARQEKEVH